MPPPPLLSQPTPRFFALLLATTLACALEAATAPPAADAQGTSEPNPEGLAPDALITGTAQPPATDIGWWYRTPAAKFWEGTPIATGRFRRHVVRARARRDHSVQRRDALDRQPYDAVNPQALPSLPEIRRLLAEEKFGEAAELAANLLSHPVPVVQTYQAMGRLHLQFDGPDAVEDYRRELDLDAAIARVEYRIGPARFKREAFASYPDQVVVIRLTCTQPGQLTFNTRLSSLHASAVNRIVGADTVLMAGGVSEPNPEIPSRMRWEARVRVIPEGGAIRTSTDPQHGAIVRVERADAVTLVLAGATNYRNWRDITADPATRCADYLAGAARRPFAELRQRHLDDYQPLFRACQLDLGTTDAAREDTTTRLERLRRGGVDPRFTSQYFQYGRYLLIAGSRPGTMAFNNHNIWLDDLKGRWRGRWTLNINLQECYWPAESTGLQSTVASLHDFIADLAASGARTARGNYGARGWTAHHGTDVWMNTAMTDRVFHGMAPTMGIWLVQHLWEHYLHDPNPGTLRRIYPLLKGAAEFGLDLLVENSDKKWLVTSPSGSPENGFALIKGRALLHDGRPRPPEAERNSIGTGSAMDMQLLRDVFRQVITASTALGVDADLRRELAAALPRLPPDQARSDGLLMEWIKPYLEFDPKHRHVSHLYAAYPSSQITRRGTPELAEAVRKVLVAKGDNRGWSAAWKINLYARLGDAESCYRIARMMETDISIHPAPEDSDRVPSMEGNQAIQGYTAGIVEMLLQSHVPIPRAEHAFELELLPALPRAWATGSIRGLRARGGVGVDLAWREGKLDTGTLRTRRAGPCRIRSATALLLARDGRPVATRAVEPGVMEFTAEANAVYTLSRR